MSHPNSNVSLDLVKRGVELYTGETVEDIKRHWDPRVEGAFALRVVLKGQKTPIFFLVDAHAKKLATPEDVDSELQDAEFESWPPKSGSHKFF